MAGDQVVAHFDGVAGVYDQVLPFFAISPTRLCGASLQRQAPECWISRPVVALSPISSSIANARSPRWTARRE